MCPAEKTPASCRGRRRRRDRGGRRDSAISMEGLQINTSRAQDLPPPPRLRWASKTSEAQYLHSKPEGDQMAKSKSAKKQPAAPKRNSATTGKTKSEGAEPKVVALAEQLGTFLGRATKKVDGVLESAKVKQRTDQIRDGAAELVKQASNAGAAATKSATKLATTA